MKFISALRRLIMKCVLSKRRNPERRDISNNDADDEAGDNVLEDHEHTSNYSIETLSRSTSIFGSRFDRSNFEWGYAEFSNISSVSAAAYTVMKEYHHEKDRKNREVPYPPEVSSEREVMLLQEDQFIYRRPDSQLPSNNK